MAWSQREGRVEMAKGKKRLDEQGQHWRGLQNPTWCRFPGPESIGDPLRVTLDREAFAEIVLHTKENLDKEVCGVLVGECCEDKDGIYVHVRAVIRGTTSQQSDRHVTFTHETWDQIHRTLDAHHPGRFIMGWYHSHPGFGVVFSDMDRFIQSNFFPGSAQIALVTDPLGGEFNVCVNKEGQVLNLKRFWVDGQEHRCGGQTDGASVDPTKVSSNAVLELEAKLERVLITLDKQKIQFERFLFSVLVLVFMVCLGAMGWAIYERSLARWKPARILTQVPIPMMVGDQAMILGVGIYGWDIPEGLAWKGAPDSLAASNDSTGTREPENPPNPNGGGR